jgi:dTDP-glucose 4,6-dehydratase
MTDESVLVTGGAGFIGSAFCRHMIRSGHRVVNVDKLTYCGDPRSLHEVADHPKYRFYEADIADESVLPDLLRRERVRWIVHLAAETHVDRSIDGPAAFIGTNIVGTSRLLGFALDHFRSLPEEKKSAFRFLHVSTDEVFGDLADDDPPFTEVSGYRPSSPYAASKAAADHLVRAWHRTYGLPVLISNCSNNYGPFQFPEKLIPLTILNAVEGRPLPVYGDGAQVRDWLFVDDHASALELVLTQGRVGQSYMVGGRTERSNLSIVQAICDLLDTKRPLSKGASRQDFIRLVSDRPGHDRRYGVDPSKAERELGWRTATQFKRGLDATIDWYLTNEWWWAPIQAKARARRGLPA